MTRRSCLSGQESSASSAFQECDRQPGDYDLINRDDSRSKGKDVDSQADEHNWDQNVPKTVYRLQDNRVVPQPSADHAPYGNEDRIRRQDQPEVVAVDPEERNIDPRVVRAVGQRNQRY